MPKRKFRFKLLNQKGFTLLEVLMSFSLSAIIVLLLATLSLFAAKHYKSENDFFLLQQHLSLGLDLIEKQIKLAGRFEADKIFVADTGRRASNGGQVYALYQNDLEGHSSELIEDIQSLTVKQVQPRGLSIHLEASRGGQHLSEYAFISLRGSHAS